MKQVSKEEMRRIRKLTQRHGRADAVRAVNLVDDADTTGAVCGQIAGAFYGESAIPAEWRRQLVMSDQIR